MTDKERDLLKDQIEDCKDEIESLQSEVRWLEEKLADAEYELSCAEEELKELNARLNQEDWFTLWKMLRFYYAEN